MALDVTTVPLPEMVRHALSCRTERPRMWWLGFLPVVGVITIVAGGIMAVVLRWTGIETGLAIGGGLGIGIAMGILFAWQIHRMANRVEEKVDSMQQRALLGGVAEMLSFDVATVWELDDLESLGPGHIIDTGTDRCVYLCGPDLPDCEQGIFPASRISLRRIPEVNEIDTIERTPGRVAVSEPAIPFARLEVNVYDEAQLPPMRDVEAILERTARDDARRAVPAPTAQIRPPDRGLDKRVLRSFPPHFAHFEVCHDGVLRTGAQINSRIGVRMSTRNCGRPV